MCSEAVPLLREQLKGARLEDVVQELFRCYRATRDLGALVREERELREALRRAYGDPDDPDADGDGCQPEPETTALFREIGQELRREGASHSR